MRIALCVQNLQDVTSRTILESLGAELRARGHRVGVYTATAPCATKAASSQVRVLGRGRGLAERFSTAILRDGAELVHLRLGGLHRNPLVWGLRRFSRRSPGISISLSFNDFGRSDMGPDCPRTARCLDALVPHARFLNAGSQFVKRLMAGRWPDQISRVRVLGHGVSLRTSGRIRRRKGGRPYILSVGRLARYKGMDLLVMAYADIAHRCATDLVIAGEDFERGHLSGLIKKLGLKKRIRLEGFVHRNALRGLMDGAELFVLASRWESFGLAVLEAMAAGKPIIATRVGGLSELIKDGRTGRLVPPRDSRALAEAMLELLEKPSAGRALGRAARRESLNRSWPATAGRYLEHWRIVARPRPG